MPPKDDHQWMETLLNRMEWPTPASDLHARILSGIQTPEEPTFLPSLTTKRLCAGLATLFLMAFILGITQNRPEQFSSSAYSTILHYGDPDLQLYQILDS